MRDILTKDKYMSGKLGVNHGDKLLTVDKTSVQEDTKYIHVG